MTIVRVKGFQIFADRHGRMRCYHRKSRIAVDLEKAPLGSAEFFSECSRIGELTKASGPPRPGTLRLLVTEYRGSPAFLTLRRNEHQYNNLLFEQLSLKPNFLLLGGPSRRSAVKAAHDP